MAYEVRISDWSSDGCSSDLLRFEAGRHVALLADEERRVDLEELRCKTLQAEHGVGSLRIRLKVVAHADLRIEEVRDQAAVEQLHLRLFEWAVQRLDRKSTRLNSSH